MLMSALRALELNNFQLQFSLGTNFMAVKFSQTCEKRNVVPVQLPTDRPKHVRMSSTWLKFYNLLGYMAPQKPKQVPNKFSNVLTRLRVAGGRMGRGNVK